MRIDFWNIINELKEEEGDNEITIRLGKTGSGKTLIQTEKDVLPKLLEGEIVWCCYFINYNGDNLKYFAPKQFDKIKNERNCTIVFDEIRRSFDPRQWETETEDFRGFVELHRHRHNNIIGNTQDIALVSKTFGIQTHNWSQVAKIEKSLLIRVVQKMLGLEDTIDIQEDYLTYSELKKMANGWELGEDVALEAEWQVMNYKKKDLIHEELNQYKIELVHKYCEKCKSRQGSQILKEQTDELCNKIYDNKGKLIGYTLKNKEFCPKHAKIELKIRLSGMFDTDYEPETEEKVFKVVKYEMCNQCGKEHIIK